MARDIPSGKTMPSVTMISLGKKPAPAGGSADLSPGAPGKDLPDDESSEASFSCPGCGMKLNVEQADAANDDEAAEGESGLQSGYGS